MLRKGKQMAKSPMEVLAEIADAYDRNELDEPARKYWGPGGIYENKVLPDKIELLCGRGGKTLLTLGDCFRARLILKSAKNGDGVRSEGRGAPETPLGLRDG